jgi:hypothetical protein
MRALWRSCVSDRKNDRSGYARPAASVFYAVYLFITTRHRLNGKELERGLGVTYKTAWRMAFHFQTLMTKEDGFEKLQRHATWRYLSDFTFRSKRRQMQNAMFDLPIGAVRQPS